MKYMIVVVNRDGALRASLELEEKVNKLIVNGWKPFGGISVSETNYYGGLPNIVMAQAMIKE